MGRTVTVTLVSAEDGTSSTDLGGQVVELIQYFCFEYALFETLLLAEGVLVFGRRTVTRIFVGGIRLLLGLHYITKIIAPPSPNLPTFPNTYPKQILNIHICLTIGNRYQRKDDNPSQRGTLIGNGKWKEGV